MAMSSSMLSEQWAAKKTKYGSCCGGQSQQKSNDLGWVLARWLKQGEMRLRLVVSFKNDLVCAKSTLKSSFPH